MNPTPLRFRSGEECRAAFPQFYEHPIIDELGRVPKWTFSDPDTKMPISVDGLLHYEKRGASCYKDEDTTTLKNLTDLAPNLPNHALYLENKTCDVAILDVEKTATAETRQMLMALPWQYAETSMSGQGLHIVIPYPQDLLERYPNAQRRTLKSSDKTWELHFEHWVTFTRNMISPDASWGTVTFDQALETLFAEQSPLVHYIANAAVFDDPENQIRGYANLLRIAKDACNTYAKRPHDFADDMSSYDFGLASHTSYVLMKQLMDQGETVAELADGDRPEQLTFVVEQAMREKLKKDGFDREKHDSPRGEMTWLQSSISKALNTHLERLLERQGRDDDAYAEPWRDESPDASEPESYIDRYD